MSVLIITAVRDVHARAVEWALRKRGIEVHLMMYGDYPRLLRVNEWNGTKGSQIELKHANHGELPVEIGALWRRRICSPMVRDDLHPSDTAVALKESQCVVDSLEELFDSRALMSANSVRGHHMARQKAVQLRLARAVGMKIPETLISNDPDEIRKFHKEFSGQIVVKPFTAPTWRASDRSYFTFTKQMPDFLLFDNDALEAAPAIYQEMVIKKFEVRAFFAGRSYLATQLNSQESEISASDWRRAGSKNMRISPIILPDAIIELCWKQMDAMGIVTGSFDFAVNEFGEYTFFEVNEQGQFLWMEQRCPEIPALEMFTDFLISRDPSYETRNHKRGDVCFAEYERSGHWAESCEIETKQHLVFDKKPPYAE